MNISTHTYKETEKKEKATVCLARPTKREEQERWQQQQKREKESDDHAHAHTHTHTHQKWHSRRSERKMVVEQWTKNPQKFSHLSQKIAKKGRKVKQTKDSAVPSIGHLKKF